MATDGGLNSAKPSTIKWINLIASFRLVSQNIILLEFLSGDRRVTSYFGGGRGRLEGNSMIASARSPASLSPLQLLLQRPLRPWSANKQRQELAMINMDRHVASIWLAGDNFSSSPLRLIAISQSIPAGSGDNNNQLPC